MPLETDDDEFWTDDDSWTTRSGVSELHERRPLNPMWRRLAAMILVGLVAALIVWVARGSSSGSGHVVTGTPGTAAGQAPVISAPADLADAPLANAPLAVPGAGGGVGVADRVEARLSPAGQTDALAAASCKQTYKVAAGDYWIGIAKKVNVKLADLLTANHASISTALYPGRSICLPAGSSLTTTTTNPSTTTTTVKSTTTTTKPKSKASTSSTTKPTTTTTPAKSTPSKNSIPAPTTTTTPPTTTTAPPPKNIWSKADVIQMIRDVWPDDLEDQAIAIATRESNLIPTVRNSCCFGLFQINFQANKSTLASWGITSAAQLYDPHVNIYAAYAMYLRANGWGPWRL